MSDITYGIVEEVHKITGVGSQRITYGIAAYSDIEDEEVPDFLKGEEVEKF